MPRNQTEIAAHFNAKYGLNIDRTTISKIINKKNKWLQVEGGSKPVFKNRRVKISFIRGSNELQDRTNDSQSKGVTVD